MRDPALCAHEQKENDMKKNEISTVRLFVGQEGGEVRCVSSDGEVRFAVGLLPGIYFANTYQSFMAQDDELEVTGSVTALKPGGVRIRAQRYGAGAMESGANPDFQPAGLSEHEHRLRKLLCDVQKRTHSLDKRIKVLTDLEVQRAVAEHQEVVDDEAAQAVEGEAKEQAAE